MGQHTSITPPGVSTLKSCPPLRPSGTTTSTCCMRRFGADSAGGSSGAIAAAALPPPAFAPTLAFFPPHPRASAMIS